MWNDKLRLALLKQNIILLGGNINDGTFFDLSEAILGFIADGAPPITIIITGDGGDIDIAMQIHDLLKLYQGETTGIVYGWARSAAVIVLQACKKRLITPSSFIQVHPVSTNGIPLGDLKDLDKMKEITDRFQQKQDEIRDLIATRSRQDPERISQIIQTGAMMDAKTAIANGFIDGIATELPAIPRPYSR